MGSGVGEDAERGSGCLLEDYPVALTAEVTAEVVLRRGWSHSHPPGTATSPTPHRNQTILAPLPSGFAVFLVHLATIVITGTGINPARSLGAAIIYNKGHTWDDYWIFWMGPFIGAALAAVYHVVIIRAMSLKHNK